ncbi:MAG: histidinol dehydrogenase [Puniceicoccales bacterium]|jgi:histidinol dehydrogenase|nr:histidinol dehydrogenase [Puniceicoccales bacterium]
MLKLDSKQKDFRAQLARFCEETARNPEVAKTVSEIIADVRRGGDVTVSQYTAKFDGARLNARQMRISPEALEKAAAALPAPARKAFDEAARNIRDYHKQTLPKSWEARNAHGARVGETFHPIRRCGLYIPGGQVPLASTVFMSALPAQLAGVPQIVACTPPRPDGSVDASILAALRFCGVSEVYAVGGVQAIALMAYGTETVPAVDKIFGPGNAYVCEAKRQVFGDVGVDLLPGPSEVAIIADATANPQWTAASLLAQAEHGTGGEKIYLIATDAPSLPDAVWQAMQVQLVSLSHAEKIRRVLDRNYCVLSLSGLQAAVEAANFIAPEHLEIHTSEKDAQKYARQITTAGAMFIGHHTPTVLGDFTAGPSHTLPTGRTGRFFSGLQVTDFMRRTSLVEYSPESLKKAAAVVAAFTEMEKLDAHGRSLSIRLEGGVR